MKLALRLARRGLGFTSPNPMVGAILVKSGRIIGRGWHHQAGMPHAEIEAFHDAARHGESARGATLYVTLEPCSTTGRTPPCVRTIIGQGVREVIAGATDPNPLHAGKGFDLLREAGVRVRNGVLEEQCTRLNEAFNHWIVHRTPLVTVKAAMTLDGKIATPSGQSKWITGEKSRDYGMRLRQGVDAIVVGVKTVMADNPSLTVRGYAVRQQPWRVVLDPGARVPLDSVLLTDEHAARTIIAVGHDASLRRLRQLEKRVAVMNVPSKAGKLDLKRLLRVLGRRGVTSVLVEGGGETNASFLASGLAHRVAFFYAPKVLGGALARKGVAGEGAGSLKEIIQLANPRWRRLEGDLLLEADVQALPGRRA